MFCKTLLSITALGYPAPILAMWADEEDDNPYVTHVAKVAAILKYLKKLPATRQDDLALIVDGYDVWFQLGPGVMISRYYEVIEAENRRLTERLGEDVVKEHNLYQSIVFGPDKICWPENPARTACWAVPESPFPRYAFGPETDSGRFREHNRPKWLNSGTIMGPIGDLIRFFEAALHRIEHATTDVVSDQFHMANMFGEQEYARRLLVEPEHEQIQEVWFTGGFHGEGHREKTKLMVPELEKKELDRYEFHITLDYESKMFQTNAYYWKYLDWFYYDGSTDDGRLRIDDDRNNTRYASDSFDRQTHFQLPQDIVDTSPPINGIGDHTYEPVLKNHDPSRDMRPTGWKLPRQLSWKDVRLGTNIVSRQVFPLIHFTPPKDWLAIWWHDMWFFPYAEAIIRTAAPIERKRIIRTPDGREWWTWVADDIDDVLPEHRGVGGFDGGGAWHSWHRLCEAHEDVVFFNAQKPVPPPPP